MSSYVEKVLDFLERMLVNSDVPKHLQEDINWAIEVISANKLYNGSFEGFMLSEERPEVKAWTDLINLKNLPVNRVEFERLKQFDVFFNEKEEEKKIKNLAKVNSDISTQKKKKEAENQDDSKLNLLN